jgi:hypothetical protein
MDLHERDGKRYVAVVQMARPVPRLGEQLDHPGDVVTFDWVPGDIHVIAIDNITRHAMLREASVIAHEQMATKHDPEDPDAVARLWWASRPGPDAPQRTFWEWQAAMPQIVHTVNEVYVHDYEASEE